MCPILRHHRHPTHHQLCVIPLTVARLPRKLRDATVSRFGLDQTGGRAVAAPTGARRRRSTETKIPFGARSARSVRCPATFGNGPAGCATRSSRWPPGIYFAPEADTAYQALGFDGSSLASPDGIARPELKSYFTSRGACTGYVPGEIVAAVFGVFNPKVVVPAVAAGWQITSREAILQARERAATAMLQRILGEQPNGLRPHWSRSHWPPYRRLVAGDERRPRTQVGRTARANTPAGPAPTRSVLRRQARFCSPPASPPSQATALVWLVLRVGDRGTLDRTAPNLG
jgi:hypothetical protein